MKRAQIARSSHLNYFSKCSIAKGNVFGVADWNYKDHCGPPFFIYDVNISNVM